MVKLLLIFKHGQQCGDCEGGGVGQVEEGIEGINCDKKNNKIIQNAKIFQISPIIYKTTSIYKLGN